MNKKLVWIFCLIIFVIVLIFINNYVSEKSYNNLNNVEYNEKLAKESETVQTKNTDEESSSSAEIVQVTSSNFNEVVLNSNKTVFIDFYADWCPPCRALSPIIDEVAYENINENLIFTRIDIDDEEDISKQYNIQSIPTLILIKDGEEIDRSIGYIDKEALLEFVNQ